VQKITTPSHSAQQVKKVAPHSARSASKVKMDLKKFSKIIAKISSAKSSKNVQKPAVKAK